MIRLLSAGNRSDLRIFVIIAIKTLKNIDKEEERYVSYR